MLTRLNELRASRGDSGFTLAETLVGASLAGIAGIIGLSLFVVVAKQGSATTTTSQLAATDRTALTQIASELQFADSPAANQATADSRFESFLANSVTFYANRSSTSRVDVSNTPPPSAVPLSRTPPSRVTISLTQDQASAALPSYARQSNLVMQVWDPTNRYGSSSSNPYPNPYSYQANYPSTPTQTIVLATGIANDLANANESLFTYCSSAPDPAPAAASASGPPPITCDAIAPSSSDPVNATRISSVIIRLKAADGVTSKTSSDDVRPAAWLTTRVAISGRVEAPVATASPKASA